MAEQSLPLRTDVPSFDFEVSLDGLAFVLLFSWNERAKRWFLTVGKPGDLVLVAGVPLVVDFPLLRGYRGYAELPPGEFLVVDREGLGANPGRFDLGERHAVLYYDLEAIAARGTSEAT